MALFMILYYTYVSLNSVAISFVTPVDLSVDADKLYVNHARVYPHHHSDKAGVALCQLTSSS